jgi:hypothetical protein
MKNSTALRFIAAVTAATIAAGAASPTWARSDTVTTVAAPRWVDQTVYRPSCRNTDRDCGFSSDRFGDPD